MDITSKPFYGTGVLRACLCLVFLASGGQALAQRNIGAAISIEREVTGALAGRTHSLNTGSGVSSNENIRTANESAAQLRFLDQTKLSIGPSASVVLDRFVYNPDRTARDEVVEVTAGAARWVSGVSRAGAEHLRTPHATMGVRGTMFDLLVEARRTIVILREGVIVVCPIRAPQRCVTLNTPGQTVIVTVTTVEGPFPTGPSETRFATCACDRSIGPPAVSRPRRNSRQTFWRGGRARARLAVRTLQRPQATSCILLRRQRAWRMGRPFETSPRQVLSRPGPRSRPLPERLSPSAIL